MVIRAGVGVRKPLARPTRRRMRRVRICNLSCLIMVGGGGMGDGPRDGSARRRRHGCHGSWGFMVPIN